MSEWRNMQRLCSTCSSPSLSDHPHPHPPTLPPPCSPYGFCLQSPPTVSTWGSPADIAAVNSMYTGVAAWGRAHGRTAFMGEAGCQVQAPSRAGRLLWYRTVGSASAALEGITVWDDDGTWKLYNRAERTWDTEVLAALFSH